MQKLIAVAVVLGALIVAAALVYHGHQLTSVAGRLEDLEQRTGGLDRRLEEFSRDLPAIVGEAGRDAGRQAVHGVFEEAIQKPLGRLLPRSGKAATNDTSVAGSARPAGFLPEDAVPLIRLDIPDPIINIEILPNLKEIPSIPWPVPAGAGGPAAETNRPPRTGPAVSLLAPERRTGGSGPPLPA